MKLSVLYRQMNDSLIEEIESYSQILDKETKTDLYIKLVSLLKRMTK